MTIEDLMSMASGEVPLPEERVNVRVPMGLIDVEYPPLMRRLIRVEFRMYGKQRWVYWYWSPEAPGPGEDMNGIDPGYSGRRIGDHGFTRAGA